MGKKRNGVRIQVENMEGRKDSFKAEGAICLFEQKTRVGMYITGELDAHRMGMALLLTMDEMAPGSEEENLLLEFILAICTGAAHSERVTEALAFRKETAEMIRDILGEEGGEEDE